jgi:hypothetical protein
VIEKINQIKLNFWSAIFKLAGKELRSLQNGEYEMVYEEDTGNEVDISFVVKLMKLQYQKKTSKLFLQSISQIYN